MNMGWWRRLFPRPEPSGPQRSLDLTQTLQKAVSLHQQGELTQAESLYRTILAKRPDQFDALHLLGVIEQQRKHYQAAVELIGRALEINPNDAPAHLHLGRALRELDRHEEALASFDRALAIKPDLADALNNRGVTLHALNRLQDALATYNRALSAKPDYVEALTNRGRVLFALARPEEALNDYDDALAIRPDHIEALVNRGNALHEFKRHAEAIACYDRALGIRPDYIEALVNRGTVLRDLKRPIEALASYDRALAIKPDNADALIGRCNLLLSLRRHEEAARGLERVLEIAPNQEYARGYLFSQQLQCCDWTDYVHNLELITSAVRADKPIAPPFAFLAASGIAADELQCARRYSQKKFPPFEQTIWRGERYDHDRIRVAYLSADFHGHATAYLAAGLFEAHDQARFETTAISFGSDKEDEMISRLHGAFTRFIDVAERSDREVAHLLKELEIDIAVDLKGYTQDCRPRILAFRPCPVQINYLGYPGTMGADFIDYIIADRFVIPDGQQVHYTEKIVYLPDTYQVNDTKRVISEHTPSRQQAGLPEAGFVFCSFNNNYKINPPVFAIWMRLLRQVEGSVLWLLGDNPAAVRNLRREAGLCGIDPDRLIFATRMKLADHLARHRLADLFLDTLPINAHTTASDALWAGLPLVTCLGSSFAGRVAGSLLQAVGLPELITDNLGDYEALALKLAQDRDLLATIRSKLARNRLAFPLFDTARFCRHIESAYETMWQSAQRGEAPANFAVAPIG